MLSAETGHSPELRIFQLHREISIAHQTLPQQINAVTDMTQGMFR
jgi:hypothetical protein